MAHINKKETGNTAGASSGTPKPLKPKRKILKRPQNDGILDISELKGTLQLQEEKSKKKKIILASKKVNSNAANEDAKNPKISGMKQKNDINGENNEKRRETIRIKEKHSEVQKKQSNGKNKEKFDRLKKNEHSRIDKERHGRLEKGQHSKNKKEKLGGLVVMCSGKTKPDCFHYRVMGVPMGKKEVMLGVKPGLKLFLYDIDLRVLYGIYKASSSGGMKLESAAFNGDFPVQVRFNVDQDCYPLPESVFKRAIKENYTGVHRFKMELTVQQVKKLVELFRPAEVQSHAPLFHPPPMVTIQDREVNEGARESWAHLHGESLARDVRTYGEGRRYHVVSNETVQHLAYKEVPRTGRDDLSQDYYPSEKDYRTYGLRRERQNVSPHRSTPTLEPYSRGHLREQPPPTVLIHDREVTEGVRESWAHQHREPLATDPRSYGESQRYVVVSNENDRHLTHNDVPPTRRDDLSQDYFPSEKEYRTYGLRRERLNLSPPRSHITPTLEPYSTGHVREHLLMHPGAIFKDAVPAPGQTTYHDSHLVTGKQYQTYSLVPRRELQSSIPVATSTMASALDSYTKDSYDPYHHSGSTLERYQPPSRREEVPLGSYSLSGRGETFPPVTDNLQTRDIYLTRSDQARKEESYLIESNRMGRIENRDLRLLHPTYASSALSYYDKIYKYPEARTGASHAPLSSQYSLAGPSL